MTVSTSSRPPRLPLTEADAVAALSQVFGDAVAEAAWAAAVRSAGLSSPVQGPDELLVVCRRLTELAEAMRVASRSLRVRLIAYNAMMPTTLGDGPDHD
jgi:hypothetical protein